MIQAGSEREKVKFRHCYILAAAVILLALLNGCSSAVAVSPGAGTTAGLHLRSQPEPVSVLYAGSLVNLMEQDLGPAFQARTGYPFQGEGRGSTALAHMIRDGLRRPDVFISAAPRVNELLMGPANGEQVRWYVVLFRNEMVVAYNPKSPFAPLFERAKKGTTSILEALSQKGMRLGRTDPALDPKGFRTLFVLDLAESFFHHPGISREILGSPENASQTFPEEQLAARLETGQTDAGFFYRNEAEEHGLPYLRFPDAVNLSRPSLNSRYARAHYTSPEGKTYHGAAIVYTLTIPQTVQNREGATAFVRFLLSPPGRRILERHGLPLTIPAVRGDPGAVPGSLREPLQVDANP